MLETTWLLISVAHHVDSSRRDREGVAHGGRGLLRVRFKVRKAPKVAKSAIFDPLRRADVPLPSCNDRENTNRGTNSTITASHGARGAV